MKKEKDILSTMFEKDISKNDRYKLGQYFTHREIVEYIINSIPLKKGNKVLDPTCGAGAFLKILIDKNIIYPKDIYGSDIDKKALELCNENVKNKSKNLILGDFINKELFKENYFDVIIGNPPFKNINLNNRPFKEVYKKATNLASLVLIKSYFLLKENGYMGFVLPKNLIRVESFKKIREFILKNMEIILIKDLDHHFKDVRCDQIVLIAQKKKPLLINEIEIIPYTKKYSFLNQPKYKLTQKEFFEYSFFPLFHNKKIKIIADKLLSIKRTLSDEAEIFRGESLKFLKEYISPIQSNRITLLRGNCIKRLGIKYNLFLKKDFSEELLSEKSKKILQDKIIIQNLTSKEGGIFSTISSKDELTMDTITNIIPKKKEYLLFLNGLLGSRLCNFFMIHLIYLNSNFSMHTDKTYIGKLPIIYPNKEINKRIEQIVKLLLSIEDKYSKKFKKEYSNLNELIYNLYNLNEKEIKTIEKSLKGVMSKKNG